ncbi:hypothetical protein [Pseudactinotalea sp. HY158]|uniref:hypothetical protein n=1 Tax=Pseudactinotalea sp. HY158 TaxID=2654547 RepID=UPI00129CA482|nr:hypothetical protein [Pseudactinotalea sp. HY158]QGH70112.1 hypothetical protein GCE65_11785 [Pseudactinotalea sp. HY158]
MSSLVHRLLAPLQSPARPQWVRTAGLQLQVYLFIWALFWAICLVGVALAILIVDQFGTVNVSIGQFVRNGPLVWFVYVVAMLTSAALMIPHVAHGMTRRSFGRGALAAGLVNALLHTIMAAGLIVVEGALYARMGWQHDMAVGPEYTAGVWEGGIGLLVLDYGLATVAAGVSGLLVPMAYRRLGGLWGTVTLPLTMLPLITLLLTTGWSDPAAGWHVGTALGTAISVVPIVAGIAVFPALTRNVALSRT